MKLEKAKEHVYKGKKVRRKSWPAHVFMALSIHGRPHVFEAPGVTLVDAFSAPIDGTADDWEFVK